jgi:hypothetical protein
MAIRVGAVNENIRNNAENFLWKMIWWNTCGVNAAFGDNVGTLIIMTMKNEKET